MPAARTQLDRTCALAAVAVALGGARAAHADPAAPITDTRNHAGLAAAGVLPTQAWRERTGPAGALLAWLDVPVSPSLTITARAGAIVHAPVTVTLGARAWLVEVPVLGGARFELARLGGVRVRAGGDVGLVVTHERVSLGGITDDDTELRFASALVLGVARGAVAVEGGPWLADLTDLDHAIGAQLTLAVRLRSW